jgi:DNA polymerase III subunit beta
MKAKVESSEVAEALRWVDTSVDARATIPALTGVRIEAGEGALELSTTDIETSCTVRVPASIEEPGAALVPRRLAKASARLPEGAAMIDSLDGGLVVEVGRMVVRVPSMSIEDFPAPPTVDGDEIDMGEQMTRAAEDLAPLVARQIDKVALTGVHVASSGTIRFEVASHYLAVALDTGIEGPGFDAIVPPSFVKAGGRILSVDERSASLTDPDTSRSVVSRLIEARFPDLASIFAQFEATDEVSVEVGDLTDAVARASALGATQVGIDFAADEAIVSATGPDGAVEVAISVAASGEGRVVANPAYLLPVVKCHRADSVILGVGRPGGPVTISSGDKAIKSLFMSISEG